MGPWSSSVCRCSCHCTKACSFQGHAPLVRRNSWCSREMTWSRVFLGFQPSRAAFMEQRLVRMAMPFSCGLPQPLTGENKGKPVHTGLFVSLLFPTSIVTSHAPLALVALSHVHAHGLK